MVQPRDNGLGNAAGAGELSLAPSTLRRTFRQRYRLVRSKWNEEWWSVALCGPVGNVLLALVADVRWVTPNALTILGFMCKLVGGPLLLVGGLPSDVAAVVLLQLGTVCDCMDGSLARYRKASSVMGAYLDKVTDAIGLAVVLGCAGWRVLEGSGDVIALVVALATAMTFVVRGYVYWVVAHLERERNQEKRSVGIDKRRDFASMTLRQRAALYAKSMWLIVQFSESDLYFWLGLGVVLGQLRAIVYLLGLAAGVWFLIILGLRTLAVVRLERAGRSA